MKHPPSLQHYRAKTCVHSDKLSIGINCSLALVVVQKVQDFASPFVVGHSVAIDTNVAVATKVVPSGR